MPFVRSGYVKSVAGAVRSGARNGYYWTITAIPKLNQAIYYYGFNINIVYSVDRAGLTPGFSRAVVIILCLTGTSFQKPL